MTVLTGNSEFWVWMGLTDNKELAKNLIVAWEIHVLFGRIPKSFKYFWTSVEYEHLRADLHDTTLSRATSLRQAYDMT